MAIIKPEQLSSGTYNISGSFSGSFHGDGSDLNNLPSNVISTGSYADFPDTGSEGYIYIDNSANIGYLWDSGSIPPTYVNIAGPSTPPDVLPLTFANAATVLALVPSPLYNNGISGSGAVLTGSINGVLSDNTNPGKIDYIYTPAVGDVILVKNQSTGSQNGLYTITSTGSVSSKYVLTRTDEYDVSSELFPLQVNILAGTNGANKSFIQSTPNPVIGTSNLVFSAASPATSFSPQIAFVDTVIDTPLTNIVYATGSFSSVVPGRGATITSTVSGSLGTWNGLSVNTNSNVTGSFTKVLVINQTNPAYNGDYSVITTGSATVFWQLQRINNNAGGFDRYTRFFLVSNTSSSKAGRMYFTRPNSPVLTNATIGTAPINIFEYGGGTSTSAFPFTGSAIITGSLTVTGSIVATTGFTGSLLGTASLASTASFVVTAQTASYVLNAVSSSFATTASYVLNAVSASWAPSVSPFPFTGSALITGSLGVTGSVSILAFTSSAANIFTIRNSTNTQNLMSLSGDGRIAIGLGAQILGNTSVANRNIVIGNGACDITSAGVSENVVSIGYNATSSNSGTAIGANTVVASRQGTAIGQGAYAGEDSIAIGFGSRADGSALYTSLAIGRGARASATLSGIIAIGAASSYTNALQQTLAFCVDPVGANSQTMLLTNNANLVFRNSTQLTSGTHWDTTATNTITIHTGSIPASNILNAFQLYSSASVAGNAAPHFRTGAGNIVKLYTQPAVTSSQGIADALTNLGLLTGSSVIATGSTPGPVGVANSLGVYTYYNTFSASMAAAPTGSTVEFFADIIETGSISVNLRNGVNINGNSHTYTLNTAGTASCVIDNGVAVSCSISNITFTRLGGTASSTNTLCMYITGASRIKAYSTNLIGGATNMRCLTINNGSAEVYGIYAEGYNPITVTSGTLNDSTAKAIDGGGISVGANGRIVKCIGYGVNVGGIVNAGLAIDSFGYDSGVQGFSNTGTAINCTGWSNGAGGFQCGGSSTNINCNGYSTANFGFLSNGATNVTSCKGYSTANVGLSMINGIAYDCLGYSTVNNGIYAVNSGGSITELRSCKAISLAAIALFMNNTTSGCKIYNTEAYSKWSNSSGHGIVVAGSNAEIVQCTVEVTSTSANCISGSSALTTKYANNAFRGANVAVNANITQGMINTQDNQGNIII